MSEWANIGVTLNRLNTGRAQNRIGFGGLSFWRTPGERVSGTSSIPSVVDSRLSTSRSNSRSAFSNSPRRSPRRAAFFQLVNGCVAVVSLRLRRRIKKPNFSALRSRPLAANRWAGARYPLPLFQSGPHTNIQEPGFRFAPPWASEVYYAFGVFPRRYLLKMPYLQSVLTLNGYASSRRKSSWHKTNSRLNSD